jgi:hypothetical protein
VTRILHRHGLITTEASVDASRWQRFEHAHPNDLWQMDFKGSIALDNGRRCSPFTVLDDHSHFNLALDQHEGAGKQELNVLPLSWHGCYLCLRSVQSS